MATYIESLVKIGLVVVEIFGGICRFLPSRPKGAAVAIIRQAGVPRRVGIWWF